MVDTRERARPAVTLAVLSVSGFAYSVLSSAVVPALPTIQHSLHASETGVAWLLTGYLLSASVGTAILGRLGDMYGKERVLVWTLVALAAGTLLAALSHTLALLIVARVMQGVAGGIFPLAFGIVRDEFPRRQVAGSIGLLSAILGIGAGVGIVVGAPDRRAPELAVAVLDAARRHRRGHVLHLAVRPRVAGARARAGQLARRRPDERGHLGDAARDERDDKLGLGLCPDARPAGSRPRHLAAPGSRSRAGAASR